MAADAANLSGDRVKFSAVEERLCDILSGGASTSQVPDTVRAGSGWGRHRSTVRAATASARPLPAHALEGRHI